MVDTQGAQETLDCNCRVKADCSLNVNYRQESVIYKCTATTSLGLTEGEFKKQRYYDHIKPFGNDFNANSTTLLSYLWEMENAKNATPALTSEIL